MSDLESVAIDRLRLASQLSFQRFQRPLIITYSGGKDSEVLLDLAAKADIPFEIVHNLTTIDAPQTVYHVRKVFRHFELRGVKCTILYPRYKSQRINFYQLCKLKGVLPLRTRRFCCQVLKEQNTVSATFIATGVRWHESVKRASSRGIFEKLSSQAANSVLLLTDQDDKRRLFEHCNIRSRFCVNPLVDWYDDDIWDYIYSYHLDFNPIYNLGLSRCGCVGCPFAGCVVRQKEYALFPAFKRNALRLCQWFSDNDLSMGLSGVDLFHWWLQDGVLPNQIDLFEV